MIFHILDKSFEKRNIGLTTRKWFDNLFKLLPNWGFILSVPFCDNSALINLISVVYSYVRLITTHIGHFIHFGGKNYEQLKQLNQLAHFVTGVSQTLFSSVSPISKKEPSLKGFCFGRKILKYRIWADKTYFCSIRRELQRKFENSFIIIVSKIFLFVKYIGGYTGRSKTRRLSRKKTSVFGTPYICISTVIFGKQRFIFSINFYELFH